MSLAMRMNRSLPSRTREQRGQISAKLHLPGQQEDQADDEQHELRHCRGDECKHRRHHAQLRRLHRDGVAGRRQQCLLQLAQRGQRLRQHVELLLDARADLRSARDPLRDRSGQQGHGDPGRRQQTDNEESGHDPRRDATPRRPLDDRREGRRDHQRRHDRQQQRAAKVEHHAQQQDENPDHRHLRGRRPDVVDALDRFRVIDDQRIALFTLGAEKLHGITSTMRLYLEVAGIAGPGPRPTPRRSDGFRAGGAGYRAPTRTARRGGPFRPAADLLGSAP